VVYEVGGSGSAGAEDPAAAAMGEDEEAVHRGAESGFGWGIRGEQWCPTGRRRHSGLRGVWNGWNWTVFG
jgi:hypothetical protein